MSHIKVLGIDIAKDIFQLCGINRHGKVIYTKTVKRQKFIQTVANLSCDMVAMEACGGANHWCRAFKKLGINCKLIAPQFVKPYVKTNKNDRNDAHAIAEVASREHTRFVLEKTLEQQDVQSLLKVRERLMKWRTALINETRGILLEYGISISRSATKFYQAMSGIIDDMENGLTALTRKMINRLYAELLTLDEEIEQHEASLKAVFKSSAICQRLSTMPGVGYLTALSILTIVNNIYDFKSAKHFSAFLGLVPRQHSSGGKERLLGISKRGNVLVRTFLIHGARSIAHHIKNKDDANSTWLRSLIERRGIHKAYVAMANKNARIIWALLTKERDYQAAVA